MTTDLTVPGGAASVPYDRPQVPTIARDIVKPRLPEQGRIRCGERLSTKDGKHRYPAKLDAFRFTSRNRPALVTVAELWGGEVRPWASDEGPQWEVYTDASSIECIVPKAELAFSQHFEDWEGATCNRRCDGHWEMQGDRECVCDPADRKCLPTTRLSVLLPEVPGMGVWRVESHGYNAAAEILGTIELAAAHGATLLPATLRLEQRSKRRYNPKSGKVETNRFVVPVLAISASLREMMAEQHVLRQRTLGLLPMAEPATPDRMRALRTAVFSRWPESVDEPERSIRLRQLSALLGRPVTTISNEHDLTAQEAIFLTNAVNELPDEDTQAAPDPGPAAPVSANPSAASGAESTAPETNLTLGSTREQGKPFELTPAEASSFLEHVPAPTDDEACEQWTGHQENGRGRFYLGRERRFLMASRVRWTLEHGPIPEGLDVCHHCDNPLCVKLGHLFLGTHQDNMQDALEKGRFANGTKHYLSKFTDKDVADIRTRHEDGESNQSIADSYGVHNSTISRVITETRYVGGSAGEQPGPPKAPGRSTPQAPPAEHHTAEVSGEVAPADGTVLAGEGRSDTGLPPGAAPTKPAPARKRQVDLVGEARKAAVVRNAGRQEIYRPPTNWLHTLPIPERQMVLSHCYSNARAGGEWLREFATQEGLTPLERWGEDEQWPEDKLALLRATVEAEQGAK